MKTRAKVRAHSNIALIKYWGKRDEKYALPMNSSLSLTLEAFYTETEVIFDKEAREDEFYLNDRIQGELETRKISNFIDLFRRETSIKTRAIVRSLNFVPTAAGLASSASGFAALAFATNLASGLNLDSRTLSTYARRGSGSATRSIYGGFVEWQKGENKDDSYAIKIDEADWDIAMVIVVVNSQEKAISSRQAMKNTVETSPFYHEWVKNAEKDLGEAREAIRLMDFESLGSISERNALMMHATMLGARPPISYWEPDTVLAMEKVRELRRQGIPAYFTMDAGPNVKILCRLSQAEKIKESLGKYFPKENIIISGPGPGPIIL